MRIQFDNHGITDHCPRYGVVDINSCRACSRYGGEYAFEVWCNKPFDELPPETQEKLLRYWGEEYFDNENDEI